MPVEPIEDRSVKIKPGDALLNFIRQNAKNISNATPGIAKLKGGKLKKEEISKISLELDDVRWLKEFLDDYGKSTSKKKVYLHELLEYADIILPTPKVTPTNPELEARIRQLVAKQNARQYEAMTKNVDSSRKGLPEDTISYQMQQINKQLIAVAQFVFSVLAGFAFGFVGVELIVGNLDFGFRLLLGIICALIIALAEIYFLAIKLNEDGFEITATPQTQSSYSKKPHQE